MDLLQTLIKRAQDRESKRAKHIREHGVDPKTVNKFYPNSGIRHHQMELVDGAWQRVENA